MNKDTVEKLNLMAYVKFYKLPWKPHIFCRTINFVMVLFIMNVLALVSYYPSLQVKKRDRVKKTVNPVGFLGYHGNHIFLHENLFFATSFI